MIKIKINVPFDLDSTVTCGQIFRYECNDDKSYTIILKDRVVNVKKNKDYLEVESNNNDNLENIIKEYFDLDYDYVNIQNIIKNDIKMKDIVEFNKGLKMIRQDPFECLISYIISQNNRVPSIANSLNLISINYGKKVKFKDKDYYLFPSLEEMSKLSVDDFRNCKVGFRDKYLFDVIKNINDNLLDLNIINNMNGKQALEYLMKNKGIGVKVASCILLFAYHKFDVFPVDTWVLKYSLDNLNLKNKTEVTNYFKDNYKEYSAIAIQYIFNYNRNK